MQCPNQFNEFLTLPTECDEGTFGQNCASPCHCLSDTPCNHVNGSCPDDLCAVGWISDNCSIGMNEIHLKIGIQNGKKYIVKHFLI